MSRAMKDSGIEWIGKIPKEWNIINIKNVATIFGRIGYRGYTVDDLVGVGEGAITLSPSNIINSKLNLENCSYLTWDKYEESPEIMVHNGDIVFVKTASVGKTAFIENVNIKITINPQFVVIKDIKINNKYLFYVLMSTVIQRQLQLDLSGGVIKTITQSDLNNYKIAVPIVEEQVIIADFLNNKINIIDNIIKKTIHSIVEYKKYKQSIITITVTKGFNFNVEMKDSGVEWIGEIPTKWDVVKLNKVCSNIGDVDHKMPEAVDEGIPYISTKDFIDNEEIDFTNAKKITKASFTEISRKIQPQIHDIIFPRYATLGSVRYVTVAFDFLVSYSCAIIKPNKERIYPRFLYYYLKSDVIEQEINRYLNSNTQSNLGIQTIKNFKILIMSVREQKKIAEYLDSRCSEIDNIITQKQKLLIEIKSYKKSLIYECVTGKREVL